MGIPSIAFSLDTSGEELDFAQAAAWAVRIARRVVEKGLPKGVLLNVNFPAGVPKGIRVTRLSTHHWEDTVVERLDPEGKPYYWIAGTPVGEEEEGTDLWAVRRGYISLTPVSLDFTAEGFLSQLEAWVRDL